MSNAGRPAPAEPLDSILLVDPDPDRRARHRDALEGAGHAVVEASGGEGALRMLEERPFDLVVLDARLEEPDAFAVCRRLRDTVPGGEAAPVLFVGAGEGPGEHERVLDAGGDDVLLAPVRTPELLVRTRALLSLKHFKDELEEGVRLIRSQRDALARVGRQREQMAGLLAHDLRTPIQSVMVNAQYLGRSGLEGRQKRAAQRILRSSDLMTRMVSNLLDVARHETGTLVPRYEAVRPVELLQEVVEHHRLQAEDRGQRLDFVLHQDPGEVELDPALVRRVVQNLLDNALKYSPRGGAISVELGAEGDEALEIRVSDEGPAVGEPYRERIFDRYVVLERGQSQGEVRHGRGLGLVFCKIAVEAHGGRIRVVDREPEGASFRFTLPLRPDRAEG